MMSGQFRTLPMFCLMGGNFGNNLMGKNLPKTKDVDQRPLGDFLKTRGQFGSPKIVMYAQFSLFKRY